MAIKPGQHRVKPPKGSRVCFFCNKNVFDWEGIAWPNVEEMYARKKMQAPVVVRCGECKNKPTEELYNDYFGYIVCEEIGKWREKKKGLIQSKVEYDAWVKVGKDLGIFKSADQYLKRIDER